METLLDKIIQSFQTGPNGFSARKLTAFTITACMVYVHLFFVEHDNVAEVLIIDGCIVLLLLGIITAQQVIELKNGKEK